MRATCPTSAGWTCSRNSSAARSWAYAPAFYEFDYHADGTIAAVNLAPLLLAATGGAAFAQAPAPADDATAMSFDAARARMLDRPDKLAAARAAVEAKQLQSDGLKRLGGPVVRVSGLVYAYNANLNLDLDPLNQKLGQIGQGAAALDPELHRARADTATAQQLHPEPARHRLQRLGVGGLADLPGRAPPMRCAA